MKSLGPIIIIFLGLCFSTKAQTQSLKITSLDAKFQKISNEERNNLEMLINGGASFLLFGKDGSSEKILREKEKIEAIVFEAVADDSNSKLRSYERELNSCKIVVFNVSESDFSKEAILDLTNAPNLKYVLVRSFDDINESIVRAIFQKGLKINFTNVEFLFEKQEEAR